MAHPLTKIDSFTFDNLNKELELTAEEKKSTDIFLQAYLDDFWQKGQGSLLPPSTGSNSSRVDVLLEKRFVFRNVIRECVGRVAGAFFGKAPNWKFQVGDNTVERPRVGMNKSAPDGETPDETTDAFLADIDSALSDFWTRQNLAEALSKAFESRLAFGRGGVRIFIPIKFKRQNLAPSSSPDIPSDTPQDSPPKQGDELVAFPDIASAIRAMRVEFVPPTQGRLLDDDGELFSIVKYSVRRDWSTRESVGVIEFSFVDDSDVTWLGTLEEKTAVNNIEDANLSSGLELAGGTTYNEFSGMPFVTKALYKNNQLLNLALTCAGFSLVDNGFGEMILTNVELETESVIGPEGDAIEVPKRMRRGGGAVQNFVGIETFDESTGATQRATPGVTFRQPTAMDTFKNGADLAYAACLQEAGQLYALISGDATASGESRIQALADFLLRIMKYKSEVDEQGGWLLTTVLLWAAQLCGKPAPEYRVVFDSRVHVANLSGSERDAVMSMRKEGVISRETERVLLGVDDPALEADLVLREQSVAVDKTPMDEFSSKLDVALKMSSVGIDNSEIQRYLGYTDAQIGAMEQAAADREAAMLAQIDAANADAGGGAGAVNPADNPTA